MPDGGRSKGDRAYRRVPVLMSARAGPERRRYGWRWIPAWGVVRIPPHAVPALVSEELRQVPGLCQTAAKGYRWSRPRSAASRKRTGSRSPSPTA
jgi:hypothetical protein